MTERGAPSRHQWLPSALTSFFGEEPEIADPWPALLETLKETQRSSEEIRERAIRDATGVLDTEQFREGTPQSQSEPGADCVDGSPMRVVLMGRTMAGKSSLLAALTGSHFNRIGDGRQRYSTDTFGAITTASEHVEVIDTPGVGAYGGVDDTAKALKAAVNADVVVWVNSDDSIQEESASALRLLGVIGKPILVVVNCKQSIEGVGRLNLLKFPDQVFGDREGLVGEIERHMAMAGVEPLDVVFVHALAAAAALEAPDGDAELHAASRVNELTAALVREYASHYQARRLFRLVDAQRQPAELLSAALQSGSAALAAQAMRDREMTNDLHARLARILRSAGEVMLADVATTVGQRRDWHLSVADFGKSLQADWKSELALMQDELDRTLGIRFSDLSAELKSAIKATDAEWTSVSADTFTLRGLPGFDGVWGNRLIRAGIGIGGSAAGVWGGAALGAKIGGVLGLETGPGAIVTAIAGGIVGGAVALSLGPLKNLADRIFLGKDGVLRKRRNEVAKQVGPILDEITRSYEEAIAAELDKIRDELARERASSEDHSVSLESIGSHWVERNDALRAALRTLDRETTVALLRLQGRERLARSVQRATRVPGVCVLAEFDASAFWEAWLYPPDIGERLVAGRPPNAGFEAVIALSYALGLVDAGVALVRADSSSATIRIDASIPSAIAETWAAALSAHIGKDIQLETIERTDVE